MSVVEDNESWQSAKVPRWRACELFRGFSTSISLGETRITSYVVTREQNAAGVCECAMEGWGTWCDGWEPYTMVLSSRACLSAAVLKDSANDVNGFFFVFENIQVDGMNVPRGPLARSK